LTENLVIGSEETAKGALKIPIRAVGVDAAGEVGPEFALDEPRDDPTLFPGGGEEGFEVLLYDAVENGGFGRAPLVRGRIGQVVTDEGVARHGWEPMRGACLG
jgi:hypothetical protein